MLLLVFVISKHDMSEKPINVAGILQPVLTTFVDVIIAATIAGALPNMRHFTSKSRCGLPISAMLRYLYICKCLGELPKLSCSIRSHVTPL
jgi:hypothetical protein